jgi:hypothetical protein
MNIHTCETCVKFGSSPNGGYRCNQDREDETKNESFPLSQDDIAFHKSYGCNNWKPS